MPLRWDSYSDQPEMIHDKAYKWKIYRSVIWDFFKMLGTNLVMFPITFIFYLIVPTVKPRLDTSKFFGLSINQDKNPQDTRQLIDDLQVNNLLIRMPLHDIENIQNYVNFAQEYADKDLLINILQDRRHVTDLAMLRQSLEQIFEQFGSLTKRFQMGNAINRKKWAIFSMDEYLRVFRVAYTLKKEKYPELILLGSSVIDFEYYFTLRTLFNGYRLRYDQFSSLLYVDRRGNPENTQLALDIRKKLYLLHAMTRLSPKSKPEIVITETNWPIKNTHPYAPTSETECIDLDDHANYLVRYYLLVLTTGVVKNVYWHQLIAPGYGLVDNRGDSLIKYPAYYAFKTLLAQIQNKQFVKFEQIGDLYRLHFQAEKKVEVCWALSPTTINTAEKQIILRDGQEQTKTEIQLGESPVYLIEKETV